MKKKLTRQLSGESLTTRYKLGIYSQQVAVYKKPYYNAYLSQQHPAGN